jgi:hypothetical protein
MGKMGKKIRKNLEEKLRPGIYSCGTENSMG